MTQGAVKRSKWAIDIKFRLWDDFHQRWHSAAGKDMWSTKSRVNNLRDEMIAKGRDPRTLSVERVKVEIA